MARVAANSLTGIINVKLCCKVLNEVAEDPYVYRNVSLKKFPIVSWKPQKKEEVTFLNKCFQYGNLEFLYRKGVVDYFSRSQFDSAFECLMNAANSGHIRARYVIGVISLFGNSEQMQQGINILREMKKSRAMRRKLKHCRNSLRKILRAIWIKNSLVINHRPKCCPHYGHLKKRGWSSVEVEEEDASCDACTGDMELSFIFGLLPSVM